MIQNQKQKKSAKITICDKKSCCSESRNLTSCWINLHYEIATKNKYISNLPSSLDFRWSLKDEQYTQVQYSTVNAKKRIWQKRNRLVLFLTYFRRYASSDSHDVIWYNRWWWSDWSAKTCSPTFSSCTQKNYFIVANVL